MRYIIFIHVIIKIIYLLPLIQLLKSCDANYSYILRILSGAVCVYFSNVWAGDLLYVPGAAFHVFLLRGERGGCHMQIREFVLVAMVMLVKPCKY